MRNPLYAVLENKIKKKKLKKGGEKEMTNSILLHVKNVLGK